jgi:hypothetical protein
VKWKVLLSSVVMWMTPLAVSVTDPVAPEQELTSASETVALTWMVSVSVAKAAVDASTTTESARARHQGQ